jgi:hypothetical protein
LISSPIHRRGPYFTNKLTKDILDMLLWRIELSTLIPILVAVIPTVATALFGLWSYRHQKQVDRENYVAQKETDRKIELRNLRMKGYQEYLTAFRANAALYDFPPFPENDDPARIETVQKYWLAYSNLFQIASDPVLLAVTTFHNFAWMEDTNLNPEDRKNEFKSLYATMIFEMRKDAFEETKLQKERVEQRLPFNFSD